MNVRKERVKDKRSGVKRVWVNLELLFSSQRDILFGISGYARRNAFWNIVIVNGKRDEDPSSLPEAERPDGIITTLPLSSSMSSSVIPLVAIGAREPWVGQRMCNLAFVRNNDRAIGIAAAKKFVTTRLFASYGFVGSHVRNYCPILREEGFRAGLGKSGEGKLRVYEQNGHLDGSSADIAALGDWLESLPKPAAVMVVHDLRATHVVSAANACGIAIPGDLSIIGVDNDELLCEFTDPPLTSIAPDHVRMGEIAAEALLTLMKGGAGSNGPVTRKCSKFDIVERDTTSSSTPSAHLAKEAMSFIRQNFKSGIGTDDVVRAVRGRSRRLLDMRFREMYGCSVHEAILRVRYSELKRRLVRSKTPIAELMKACGFSDLSNAKRLFRSRFGMSMREWRGKCGKTGIS